MLNQVSEQKAHVIRYILVVGWLLLIASLFYDPISAHLTDPNTSFFSPLKDDLLIRAGSPETCILLQGECIKGGTIPYQAGARIFWGFIVPAGFAIVFVLGHEFWRRICPLYFLSQIPRALGMKPKKQISQNKWLIENHLYLQFVLFFIGLNMRILFINSARPVFGGFLLFTISAAIIMNLFYGGRSWCHYVCPFGMVQMVLTGPRGLLGSEAQKQPPKTITQSMCRTFDKEAGKEKITCISCKSPCMDIDSEKAYWEQLYKPGRNLVQYGYLGLVFGYFIYYFLYSGNFDYYFSGSWTHEKGQVSKIFNPGFYLGGNAIPIPKLIATPLTLAAMVAIFYFGINALEKIYGSYLRKQNPNVDRNIIRHRVFTSVTFVAVNAFFVYGGRPEILRFPFIVQMIFNGFVVLVSSFWLYRTWGRTDAQYKQESIADKLRRQLKKLQIDFNRVLGNRTLDDLKAGELDLLAQVLPQVTKQDRLAVYKGVLEESLQSGSMKANDSLKSLESVRNKLEMSEEEHYALLSELSIDEPSLIDPNEAHTQENHLRLESYKEGIVEILQELVDSGIPVHEAVNARSRQIGNLKNEYNINRQEHIQVLGGLFDSLRPKAEKLLALLQIENSRYQVISNFPPYSSAPVFMLLRKLLLAKQQLIVTPLLAVLELLNNEPDGIQLAQRTGQVATDALKRIFAAQPEWQQRLSPNILRGLMPGSLNSTQETVIRGGGSATMLHSETLSAQAVDDALLELLQEPNPITESASLYALAQLNPAKASAQAQQILHKPLQNDLVQDTAASILGQSRKTSVIEQLLSMSRQANFQSMTTEQLLSMVTEAQHSNRDITEIAPPPR